MTMGEAGGEPNGRYGHPRFYELTELESELHSRKNYDYANGGDPLGNFERVSKILALYPGFPHATKAGVAVEYALKQLDAAMWSMAKGYELKTEGIAGRLTDISVYMKIALICLEEDSRARAGTLVHVARDAAGQVVSRTEVTIDDPELLGTCKQCDSPHRKLDVCLQWLPLTPEQVKENGGKDRVVHFLHG